MPALAIINGTLALILELAALWSVGFLGYQQFGNPFAKWLAAAVFVGILVALWGKFAAPSSPTRLVLTNLLLFKIAIFAIAAAALFYLNMPLAGIIYAVTAIVHLALATAIKAL